MKKVNLTESILMMILQVNYMMILIFGMKNKLKLLPIY